MPVIYLVSCTAQKASEPKPAKDLYVSEQFVLSRQFVERCLEYLKHCEEGVWFILSSKHHLVDPETVLEPYNDYLGDKLSSEHRTWAQEVFRSLTEQVHRHGWEPRGMSLVILAGKLYWEFVEHRAKACGFKVYLPWQDECPPGLKGQGPLLKWRKDWLRKGVEQIEQGDFSFCEKWWESDNGR